MYPDMTGWWRCCECQRDVNPNIYTDGVCSCSHSMCETCERYDLEPRDSFAPEDDSIHLDRAKPKAIPFVLVEQACADTGCEVNCITRSLAQELGANLVEKPNSFRLPVEGKTITSSWMTSIECRSPHPPFGQQILDFFVFSRILGDVILGRRFLRETNTLDIRRERLKEYDPRIQIGRLPMLRSIGTQLEEFVCWLDGRRLASSPDTGAQVSLLSKAFAASLQSHVVSHKSIGLQIADGSELKTHGAIEVVVSFCEPTSCTGAVRALRDHNPDANPQSTRSIRTARIKETFHVSKILRSTPYLEKFFSPRSMLMFNTTAISRSPAFLDDLGSLHHSAS